MKTNSVSVKSRFLVITFELKSASATLQRLFFLNWCEGSDFDSCKHCYKILNPASTHRNCRGALRPHVRSSHASSFLLFAMGERERWKLERAVKTICSPLLEEEKEKRRKKVRKKASRRARREKPSSLTTSCAESERVGRGRGRGPFAGDNPNKIESGPSFAPIYLSRYLGGTPDLASSLISDGFNAGRLARRRRDPKRFFRYAA